MNRGSLGVRELNTSLQGVLNPVRPGEPSVEKFGWRFLRGDKVIQTENDYDKDVFKGMWVSSRGLVRSSSRLRFDSTTGGTKLGTVWWAFLFLMWTPRRERRTELVARKIVCASRRVRPTRKAAIGAVDTR